MNPRPREFEFHSATFSQQGFFLRFLLTNEDLGMHDLKVKAFLGRKRMGVRAESFYRDV